MQHFIIAIMPELVKGYGISSIMYTEEKIIKDKRSPELILKNLYEKKGKSKKIVDKHIKKKSQIKRNLPYVIDQNHVFFPCKIRNTQIKDNNRAFVNVRYVKEIANNSIILITEEQIATINTEKTLIQNKNLACLMLYEQMIEYLEGAVVSSKVINRI